QHFVFLAQGVPTTSGIFLGSLDSSETTRLTTAESAGVCMPPGWLLWARAGTLVAQRLDLKRRTLTGDAVEVADTVVSGLGSGTAAVSAPQTGVLAYRTGAGLRRQLQWFDRTGKLVGTFGEPDDLGLSAPRITPDGRHAVVWRTVPGNVDIFTMDGTRTERFT